jgi:hypothetical protein
MIDFHLELAGSFPRMYDFSLYISNLQEPYNSLRKQYVDTSSGISSLNIALAFFTATLCVSCLLGFLPTVLETFLGFAWLLSSLF